MGKKWRTSPKRYTCMPTSNSGGFTSGQGRPTLLPMPWLLRFMSIGFMIMFVLPSKIQGTVYMINQCGRTIHSAGDMIFSQGGLYYPPNTNCTVTIATPSGDGRVLLQLHESELRSDDDCNDDYLEVSDIRVKDDSGHDVDSRRICGATTPLELVSEGSSLRLRMVTDGMGNGRGWSGVFTNVLPSGISLCLNYDQFECSNGRCIPSVLRCDSVNHCGDNSDEIDGCEDDLPYYLGDRVVEKREAVYIGLALGFTAIFAIYFATVCTRDSCRQIRRSVKKLMNRRNQAEEKEPVEGGLEAELRQALMGSSMYDRRVSQPWDTTLNTITGGELARQLKLELRKIQENSTGNGIRRSDPLVSTQRSINHNYDRIHSTSELINLIDRENNNNSDKGYDNDAVFMPDSPYRVSFDSIPSVVVSEDGDENAKSVLYDPEEAFSKVVPRNTSRGLYQKRLSRGSVTSIPEEQLQSRSEGTSTIDRSRNGMSSRFNVTAVPEEKSPSKFEGASTSDRYRSESISRFQVKAIPEEMLLCKSDDASTTIRNRSDSISRFQVTTVPEEKLLLEGASKSDRNRSESVSRFQVTTVPEESLSSKSERADPSVRAKATTPSKPRFSVSQVPEDEVQSHPKVHRSISTPTTSRFSVTSVDENEQKKEGVSQVRRASDVPNIPTHKYLRVPSRRRSSAGAGKTASSVARQLSNRFTVQPVNENLLHDKQNDSKDNRLKKDSVGITNLDFYTKSEGDNITGKPTNTNPSRFTVHRVAEEPQAAAPKKLISILKKFETLPDGTRSYTGTSRFRRASEGASLDGADEVEDDLPASAVTVHGYTSVKFWDEKRERYSYVSHL